MYTNQYNSYGNFLGDNVKNIVVVYERLIELIRTAQTDTNQQESNLEKSLEVMIKLVSSLEKEEVNDTTKSLQAFYLLTIKRISKILYCNNTEIYDRLISDIVLVKNSWKEIEG